MKLWIPPIGIIRTERIQRILSLSGWETSSNPFNADAFAGWGRKPTGEIASFLARTAGKPFITLEDGFLRSVGLGLSGVPPLSIVMDDIGIYFDGCNPSKLENILADGDLEDLELLNRAHQLRIKLREYKISKYNTAHDKSELPVSYQSYLLVIDQRAGDQSIVFNGANTNTFELMLNQAIEDHPDLPIVIKAHPDSQIKGMKGHFRKSEHGPMIVDNNVNPWTLIKGAEHVYTVSSQMGFEALMAEKHVTVFGRPFYAGWGLTHDTQEFERRKRKLTIDQLTAAALLIYPTYYDPNEDILCDAEKVTDRLIESLNNTS